MDLGFLAKRAEKLVADNTPAILSALGATGVVVTALLVGKASFRSAAIIAEGQAANESLHDDDLFVEDVETTGKMKDAETARKLEQGGMSVAEIADELNRAEATIEALLKIGENTENFAAKPFRPLDNRAKFNLVWKEYVPAVVIGTITLAAIFGANHVSTRRAVAMATAFKISQTAAEEYQDKVLQKIGKTKEGQIRDELAQDQADRISIPNELEMYMRLQPGRELWFDGHTMRPFSSDMETVRAAVNDLNEIIFKSGSASLTDFYELLHLDPTTDSDELGWTAEKILRADYRVVRTRLGPAMMLVFVTTPIREFYRFG